MSYLQVAECENSEAMELPTEEDGTVMLSTVAAQFPGCCGLKYRHSESKAVRGIRLTDDRLHPPTEGWGENVYLCSFQNKRKIEESDDEKTPTKMTRLEEKLSGSDLIVLGVAYSTTEDTVRTYFEQFGSLKVVQIKRDFHTGQSKGFAFIRYSSVESQLKVLRERHFIDGRWCSVRIPSNKESSVGELQPPSKLFIGRVAESMTVKVLEDYFSQFGRVVDVYIPKPHRSFAFITFHDSEIARKLCGEDHLIDGSSVTVSTATPKQNKSQNTNTNYGYNGPPNNAEPNHSNMQYNLYNGNCNPENDYYEPRWNKNNDRYEMPREESYDNEWSRRNGPYGGEPYRQGSRMGQSNYQFR